MRPALIEWPTRMNTDDDTVRALPSRASASPPRFASLSTKTGRPMRAARLSATSTPSQPRRRPGVDTMPVRGSIGRGQRESDGEDVAHRAAEGLHHVAEQDGEPVELGVVAVVEGERERALRDDRAGRVGDRDVQLARAEVDAGDEAELARERDEGRPAAAARGEGGVQQSRGGELLDDVRHRRGGEAGASRQLDLRQPPMTFQRLDKPGSVGFTK